jgi:methyl-accepting chemotaxis protein
MSHAAALNPSAETTGSTRAGLYVRVAVLLTASVIICATLIIRYTDWQAGSFMAEFSSLLELGINTLLPYMISAVVAAITAIAIMAMLAARPAAAPPTRIVERLRRLVEGDLSSRVSINAEGNLREVSYELNRAVATLNLQVSKLKVLNRQQWQSLCEIRSAVEAQNFSEAVRHIENMEQNWTRIAEVEKSLNT